MGKRQALEGVIDASLPPHDRILAVARDMFCRDGIHATGIDRILDAANASKMTLYTRFGSKEALLRAALIAEGTDWRERYRERLFSAGTVSVLRRTVTALGEMAEAGPFYGCAFMNAIAEHTKGELWLRSLAADHHAALRAMFGAQAVAEGFANSEMLARQLLLIAEGTVAALMVVGDASVLEPAERNLDAVLAASR